MTVSARVLKRQMERSAAAALADINSRIPTIRDIPRLMNPPAPCVGCGEVTTNYAEASAWSVPFCGLWTRHPENSEPFAELTMTGVRFSVR